VVEVVGSVRAGEGILDEGLGALNNVAHFPPKKDKKEEILMIHNTHTNDTT
jgi:hypothetical protein